MKKLIFIPFLVFTNALFAQGVEATEADSLTAFLCNPLLVLFSFLALILAFVIYMLANAALTIMRQKDEEKKRNKGHFSSILILILLIFNLTSNAQETTLSQPSGFNMYISSFGLIVFLLVIGVELIAIIFLHFLIKKYTREHKQERLPWWNKYAAKLHKIVPIEEEHKIDLGHDYDGIRELDNPTPPWWRYAFYLSMIFAVVYLYRYHIAHSAPLQIEELEIAIAKGEADKRAYLANSPNAFDENTITIMEASDIAEGAGIFAKNCVACHASKGEGNNIGPNLTDAYWIHGGGIKNVFSSIKYGWVEKGMKAWQDDLSSLQIAQVANFVWSLQESNPQNAKAPEGNLWTNENIITQGEDKIEKDSTVVAQ